MTFICYWVSATNQGEVFGFLGVNGAGKTSTSAIGYINGKSIINEQLAIRRIYRI